MALQIPPTPSQISEFNSIWHTWLDSVRLHITGILNGDFTFLNFKSTGIQDNATSTAITIDSSDNVTINNDITIQGGFTSTGIDDNSTSNAITIDSSEDVQFIGTAQFAAGEGCVFNGDVISSANTLDDYEEGIWTPVLSDGTNNATHSIQVGTYEKIGRQVAVKGYLVTTSLGSVSGPLRITGLPFASGSATNTYSPINVADGSGLNISAGYNIGGFIIPNFNYINLRIWNVAAGTSGMFDTEWSANGGCMFSITYYVD